MEKNILEFVEKKTHDLMGAFSCSQEAKDAAQRWLDAIGTDKEEVETRNYLNELDEDVVTIEGLISFAESENGKSHFGEEVALGIVKHAKKIQAQGAKYCDCPACQAALAILDKKEEMLK